VGLLASGWTFFKPSSLAGSPFSTLTLASAFQVVYLIVLPDLLGGWL
jgi:hypothetical protein